MSQHQKIKRIKFSEKDLPGLERSREYEKWLNSLLIVILKKYRGEYIAVKNKTIITHPVSWKDEYQKIDELELTEPLSAK